MSSRDVTQTYRPILGQRADVRRPGHVYLWPTYRVDRDGMPTVAVEDGYVGKSARPLGVRDDEHRNGKGGDPALVSPWSDLAVPGAPIILESGWFTDVELARLELFHIERLEPRYNDACNPRPDKVRKFEARRHRDARDAARGLVPRQWEPLRIDPVVPATPNRWWPRVKAVLRSAWTWWAVAWTASAVTAWIGVGWLVDGIGQDLTFGWHATLAVVLATAGVGRLWWWASGRKRWRRWKRRR